MIDKNILLIGDTIGLFLQPLYFALFLIFTKSIKKRRILFMLSMIIEHFILRYCIQIKFSINFELTYTILTYILLKLIYKDKARITDIITFIISILLLGIVSVLTVLIFKISIVSILISNIGIIILTYLIRHKLTKIDEFYNKFWNRHENNKMLKSVTIRGISSILTIITFILIHIWLIYGIYMIRR